MAQTETKKRANATVTVTKLDGKLHFQVHGAGVLVFDPDKASAQNRAHAMIHGFTQRISDGAALSRDPETGLPATPQAKLERMRRIAEHYESGSTDWAMRAAAGPKEDDPGLIIMAMMRALGRPLEGIEQVLEATQAKRGVDRKAALAEWRKVKQVAEAILAIKAERAAQAATVSVDDLLAEIEGDDGGDDGGEGEEEAPL